MALRAALLGSEIHVWQCLFFGTTHAMLARLKQFCQPLLWAAAEVFESVLESWMMRVGRVPLPVLEWVLFMLFDYVCRSVASAAYLSAWASGDQELLNSDSKDQEWVTRPAQFVQFTLQYLKARACDLDIICGLKNDFNGCAEQCRAKTAQHLWKETVCVESLLFTLSIFQGASLPTLSNLVQWTPLVARVYTL